MPEVLTVLLQVVNLYQAHAGRVVRALHDCRIIAWRERDRESAFSRESHTPHPFDGTRPALCRDARQFPLQPMHSRYTAGSTLPPLTTQQTVWSRN